MRPFGILFVYLASLPCFFPEQHTPVFSRESPLTEGASTPRMALPSNLNRNNGLFASTPPGTPPVRYSNLP